jgi:UDPglucose 6-dehydrogenase
MEVAIIGYGWVGKAMKTLFPSALVYDPYYFDDSGSITLSSKEQVNQCDVTFICVPTPNTKEGDLDISIVEEVVAWCESPLIVIRSTVNPGTCDYLKNKYNKRLVIQPEYLGESVNHPMTDQKTRPFLIIGGEPHDRRILIDLYTSVYNANINIRQVTAYEAEVIKLSENRAIAFKVAECQELYDACQASGIDYYVIREAVYSDDPRFNLWWTWVYNDNRGFQSKCIPKDVYAWCAWAESLGYNPVITRCILDKNKEWTAT